MDIIQKCLAYFKNIDIDFDLLVIADTQSKTAKNSNYVVHADESEFFSQALLDSLTSNLYDYSFRKLSDSLNSTIIEKIKKQAIKAAQIL